MRFVELKSQHRLDLQTLHRARSRLVAARKAPANQLRAILLERGHSFRQGRKVLQREIDPFLAEPPTDLSTRMLLIHRALAAKLVRIAWASLPRGISFERG